MAQPISLRDRALGYLARREHSRHELQRKLAAHVKEGDDLETLLDDLQKRGWLSDIRFAEQVVHVRGGRYGSVKVAHELREKGVADNVAERAVSAMDDLANAKIAWRKKFGVAPNNREEWVKQARFLQSRGFGFDVIKKVLKQDFDADS